MNNFIFVFGSNLRGRHGAGAAEYAAIHYGAEEGVGEGLTGYSYALPTKDENIETRDLADVKTSVNKFITSAKQNAHLKFKVTRIGCGLAGFSNRQIAPLFAEAPSNCGFDPEWKEYNLPTWQEIGIE
jgi:hypothetical protein